MESVFWGFLILQMIFSLATMGLVIASIVFMIMSLMDIMKRSDQWNDKTLWIILVLLVPFCQFIYWFMIRPKLNITHPIAQTQHYVPAATPSSVPPQQSQLSELSDNQHEDQNRPL